MTSFSGNSWHMPKKLWNTNKFYKTLRRHTSTWRAFWLFLNELKWHSTHSHSRNSDKNVPQRAAGKQSVQKFLPVTTSLNLEWFLNFVFPDTWTKFSEQNTTCICFTWTGRQKTPTNQSNNEFSYKAVTIVAILVKQELLLTSCSSSSRETPTVGVCNMSLDPKRLIQLQSVELAQLHQVTWLQSDLSIHLKL